MVNQIPLSKATPISGDQKPHTGPTHRRGAEAVQSEISRHTLFLDTKDTLFRKYRDQAVQQLQRDKESFQQLISTSRERFAAGQAAARLVVQKGLEQLGLLDTGDFKDTGDRWGFGESREEEGGIR